jgi:ketosteroid isomerase-like protein
LGVTTGDWTFTAPGIKPIHGRYVTTWRKTRGGQWKALTDMGNPDPN